MNQAERQIAKVNPFSTCLITGLGWGFLLGFVDGLPILLELPILAHLWDRLQAWIYLIAWYEFVGAILGGLVGLVGWGILQFLRPGSGQALHRETGRSGLVAIYSGIVVGLVCLTIGVQGLGIPVGHLADYGHIAITLLLVGLGGVAGLVVSSGVYGWASWWQGGRGFLRPLRWKVVRTGIFAIFLAGVVILAAVAVYRGYLRDLTVFRSRSSAQAATPDQPNVLLITIDALRVDHLGVYGYDPDISPNIDGLARQGLVFDQAISQAPRTVPSVSSFMTSLYPAELGLVHKPQLQLDRMRVTLAEVLQDAGYRTQAYVSNSLISPANWFDQGFDGYFVARSELSFDLEALRQRTLLRLMCDESGEAFYAEPVCALFDQGYQRVFDRRLTWGRGQPVTEYGVRFLRRHRDERFFLWLFYIEPHVTYNPPQPFLPLPDGITPTKEQILRTRIRTPDLHTEVRTPEDFEALVSLYDGEIAYADALVGQVLDELDRLGLTDRTLIILNADHGEEFKDHGDYAHGHTLYDELVHVPLIVSGPAVAGAGRRVEAQVRMLDLLPTVCEIAGVPVPAEAEGRSLVPLLQGEELEQVPAFSEALFTQAQRKAIRHDGYKLIYDVESGEVELYDLHADPHEQSDLVAEEPEVAEGMFAELETWMARNARVAAELPRHTPLSQEMDDGTRRQLREAGY